MIDGPQDIVDDVPEITQIRLVGLIQFGELISEMMSDVIVSIFSKACERMVRFDLLCETKKVAERFSIAAGGYHGVEMRLICKQEFDSRNCPSIGAGAIGRPHASQRNCLNRRPSDRAGHKSLHIST
jgi:hypothetical protein